MILMKHYVFRVIAGLLVILPAAVFSQADNEIQVYASAITPPKVTLVELHQNHTFNGAAGMPDSKVARWTFETLEITRGLGKGFELGFYTFTGITPGGKYEYLGNHIRPRYTFQKSNSADVGVSISLELGFIRPDAASSFQFDGELRPVFDKTAGHFYVSFNPNIAFASQNGRLELELGPQCKTVFTIHQKFGLGLEYYTLIGTDKKIYPVRQQEHLLGPVVDLYSSAKWELQGGLLLGLTPASNHQVVKLILGRRLSPEKSTKG